MIFHLFERTWSFLSKNWIPLSLSVQKHRILLWVSKIYPQQILECLIKGINRYHFCFIFKRDSQLTNITDILNNLHYNIQQCTTLASKTRHDTSKVTPLNDKIFSMFLYSEIILKYRILFAFCLHNTGLYIAAV